MGAASLIRLHGPILLFGSNALQNRVAIPYESMLLLWCLIP